jgi:pilus assembly protein CpaB
VVERPKVKVLVAKGKIDMGTMLKNPQALFAEQAFDEDAAPKNVVKEFAQLKDCQLQRRLLPGDSIHPEDLLPPDQIGLAHKLPPGYRAFGLRVDVEQIAGGFASLPLSRVDIYWTSKGEKDESFSKLLLQNVLVLAADTNDNRGDLKAMLANTVTFALTPEECAILGLAQQTGTLRLVLRSPGDSKHLDTVPMAKAGQLFSGRGQRPLQTQELDQGDPFGNIGSASPKLDIPDVAEKKPEVKPDVKAEVKPDPVVVKVEAPPAPRWRKHTMTVYNGEHRHRHTFYLDENDNVVPPDVLQASPPVDVPSLGQLPPAAQPPQTPPPAPTPPAGSSANKKSP